MHPLSFCHSSSLSLPHPLSVRRRKGKQGRGRTVIEKTERDGEEAWNQGREIEGERNRGRESKKLRETREIINERLIAIREEEEERRHEGSG